MRDYKKVTVGELIELLTDTMEKIENNEEVPNIVEEFINSIPDGELGRLHGFTEVCFQEAAMVQLRKGIDGVLSEILLGPNNKENKH